MSSDHFYYIIPKISATTHLETDRDGIGMHLVACCDPWEYQDLNIFHTETQFHGGLVRSTDRDLCLAENRNPLDKDCKFMHPNTDFSTKNGQRKGNIEPTIKK